MNVTAMGRAGLSGAKGKVARAASRPVSRMTPWTQDQIEAALGGVLVLLATLQLVRTLKRMWDAREESGILNGQRS